MNSQLSPRIADGPSRTSDSANEAASPASDSSARGIRSQAASPLLVDTTGFRRPRFLVLPTGRMFYSWGIWDSQKHPLASIPTCIFKMSDFVSRHRNLGKAYAFARRLNERHEQKVAA
jgi:hypothetical protein